MTDEQFVRIKEIAKEIKEEKDPGTNITLVEELNRLLDEHVRPSPPKTGKNEES